MALMPYETDSPLSIDSNRVLPFPIASQCFQLISRRRSQNAQLRRGMKLEQFSQGDPLDGTERPAVVIVKKLLSFLGAKALNHTHRILRHTLYVKQRMLTMPTGARTQSLAGDLPEFVNPIRCMVRVLVRSFDDPHTYNRPALP